MPKHTTRSVRPSATLLISAGMAACLAMAPWLAHAAPSLTAIYSFQGGKDGAAPVAGLIADSSGALYGTTPAGGEGCGKTGCGTIFKLSPPAPGQSAWTEAVIHQFSGSPDGSAPMASLIVGATGILYGTTSTGGQHGLGTVFSLTPPAPGQTEWTETILYSFKKNANAGPKNMHHDGANPVAPLLIDAAGNLYGTTMHGGMPTSFDSTGIGTIFRLSPPAAGETTWTETQLKVLAADGSEGAYPESGLIMDASGVLYGTTRMEYSGGLCGSVFELTPGKASDDPWTETTIGFLATQYTSACYPTGSLYMDASGKLFDTSLGQAGFTDGGVFSLTPPGTSGTLWPVSPIWVFPGPPRLGANPYSGVIADSLGNLYGTTSGGVNHNHPEIGGSIFELVPPAAGQTAWTKKTLVKFNGPNGSLPKSGLLKTKDGTLYGTTQAGGTYGYGTVFALARPGK